MTPRYTCCSHPSDIDVIGRWCSRSMSARTDGALLAQSYSPALQTTLMATGILGLGVARKDATGSRLGSRCGLSSKELAVSYCSVVWLYKSPTELLGRSTPAVTLGSDGVDDEGESRLSLSQRPSWEEEDPAPENKVDRMTIWIQSVEEVVDEAREVFNAASTSTTALPPPLPLAPISRRSSSHGTNRSGRANRVPRKILPANQIFVNEYESGMIDRSTALASVSMSPLPSPFFLNTMNFAAHSLPTSPSELPSRVSHDDHEPEQSFSQGLAQEAGSPLLRPMPERPSQKRRATVVTRSPETKRRGPSLELDPIEEMGNTLEFELEHLAQPTPAPRLSTVVDKNLFIATPSPGPQRVTIEEPRLTPSRTQDDLTASPLHVEPYPARQRATIALDTPAKRHLEGVYDRFLMSTTGVKRNGKGYQSEHVAPVGHIARPHSSMAKRRQKFFASTCRPMPPPVSSDDLRRASSVDEFGTFCPSQSTPAAGAGEQNKNTITVVRKAFKAIVTGKPAARSAKPVWV
ncbi:hypothetical protein C8Q77DRAFT_1075749 [Trametes polyzona]|nr:hypothetical protein C8Q77DRAFT_1075749 [Trametes polyzona]